MATKKSSRELSRTAEPAASGTADRPAGSGGRAGPVRASQRRSPSAASNIALVTGILQNYADKAVFHGFSAGAPRAGRIVYHLIWHYDQPQELVYDARAGTLAFTALLPAIPQRSEMYRDFKRWLAVKHTQEVVEHRRVLPKKAKAACANKGGVVSLSMTTKDGDVEYSTRKLIHLVDEIFKIFLFDSYQDYLIDRGWVDLDRY